MIEIYDSEVFPNAFERNFILINQFIYLFFKLIKSYERDIERHSDRLFDPLLSLRDNQLLFLNSYVEDKEDQQLMLESIYNDL